jgi:hypothetical protein
MWVLCDQRTDRVIEYRKAKKKGVYVIRPGTAPDELVLEGTDGRI